MGGKIQTIYIILQKKIIKILKKIIQKDYCQKKFI